MIEPEKLFQLSGGQKRRKLALTFGALERDIAGIAEKGHEYAYKNLSRREYTKKLVEILLKDPKLPLSAAEEMKILLKSEPFDELRLCNCARNHLLALIGSFPAEWDLVIAPHSSFRDKTGAVQARSFYKGVSVYAEDIRSPFNMGSIFRTAEGMGAENVYISPFCTDPMQPRAQRSSMGCIETMGWKRIDLNSLPEAVRLDPYFYHYSIIFGTAKKCPSREGAYFKIVSITSLGLGSSSLKGVPPFIELTTASSLLRSSSFKISTKDTISLSCFFTSSLFSSLICKAESFSNLFKRVSSICII